MMDIQFRNLKPHHYPQIIALWDRVGLPSRRKGRDSKEEISTQIEKNPELFIGVFMGERLIGMVVGSDDGRKGWLNRLAVDPAYRNKGIGRALVDECEFRLKTRGRKIICVQVEDWNTSSLDFFRHRSYVLHPDIYYLSKRESDDV